MVRDVRGAATLKDGHNRTDRVAETLELAVGQREESGARSVQIQDEVFGDPGRQDGLRCGKKMLLPAN